MLSRTCLGNKMWSEKMTCNKVLSTYRRTTNDLPNVSRSLIGKNSDTFSGTCNWNMSVTKTTKIISLTIFVELARFHWQNTLLQLFLILVKVFIYSFYCKYCRRCWRKGLSKKNQMDQKNNKKKEKDTKRKKKVLKIKKVCQKNRKTEKKGSKNDTKVQTANQEQNKKWLPWRLC